VFRGEALEPSHSSSCRCARGHCSGYSVPALTSGVLERGGDLNAGSLEEVLEVWSHVRVAGANKGFLVGRRQSPQTGVAASVRGDHCSGCSDAVRTSGVPGHGGDLNAGSLEWVLEVWGHVRVAGEGQCMSWEGYTRTYEEFSDNLLEVPLGGSAGTSVAERLGGRNDGKGTRESEETVEQRRRGVKGGFSVG